jgi:hypothetical protein
MKFSFFLSWVNFGLLGFGSETLKESHFGPHPPPRQEKIRRHFQLLGMDVLSEVLEASPGTR